jgi:glucosylceramidase
VLVATVPTRVPVAVWLTTGDQAQLLARQPDLAFGPEEPAAPLAITVDEGERFQPMEGFGASFTESAAVLVHDRLTAEGRDAVMRKLFDPQAGIGLSFLRQPMGASDFALSSYTYDDVPPGRSDPDLAHFSMARDDAAVIPLLRQARALNPRLAVMGTPWSPPAWMKTSRSFLGGTLDPAAYDVYARYFVRFVQAYAERGVPIQFVTVQNEPHFSPPGYPGMVLSPAQEAEFVGRHLGPAFAAAGLDTRIVVFDGNWDGTAHALALLADPEARPFVAGTAFHCYAGDPSRQLEVQARHPDKAIYLTECSGGGWSPDFAANLRWGVHTLVIEATRAWARTVVTWNMALDQHAGPQNGGCPDCRGVVTVDTDAGKVSYNVEYYVLGHASRFVVPGAVRIGSTTFGSGSVESVAFQNPDGTKALVVLNSADVASTFGVRWSGSSFRHTLPAGAVATFSW